MVNQTNSRSSVGGRFVTEEEADSSPETTITERRPRKMSAKSRRRRMLDLCDEWLDSGALAGSEELLKK